MIRFPLPLRTVLALDAIASGATGLLMAAGAGALAAPLGLPQPLLFAAGAALIPFAAFVGRLALQAAPARAAAWSVVAINVAWVAGTALLLATGAVQPTMLGYVFAIGQAAAVGVLAELQVIALKAERRAVA